MNANHLTISFFLTLLLPLASALNSDSLKRGSRNIPAMYVFGDSLFGNGNNKYLGFPSNDASFLPYGMDFAGSKPTGRYTNGKTVADYLAILLGLPFPPAYLSLSKRQRSKITTGITYASGGSGILQETNNKTSLTLPTQLKIFNRTVQNDLPKMFKEQAVLERHLSESLFVISAGVNDYGQIENRILPSTRSFALFLLKELSRHNERLPRMLYQLQSQLPGLIFVHSDLYGFLVEMRTTLQGYWIRGSLAALIELMVISSAVATLFLS